MKHCEMLFPILLQRILYYLVSTYQSVSSVPVTELEELQREVSEKDSQISRLTVLVENSQEELKAIGDIMVRYCDVILRRDGCLILSLFVE